jgi:hypothetical protein
MQALTRNAESVKRHRNQKSRDELLQFIELQLEAAYAFASELEPDAMWLRHGLVPAEHIELLLIAEAGDMQ